MTALLILAAVVVQTAQPVAQAPKQPSTAPFARAAFEAQLAAPKTQPAISGDEALRLAARARELAGAPAAPPRQLPATR